MKSPKDSDDLDRNQSNESNSSRVDDQQVKKPSTRLGYFNYRPDYLQRFNTPRWLLAVLCLYVTAINVSLLGFRGVVVPQIEKRFNMTSTFIGTIMSSVDIANGVSGILLTYYVGQRHKSKWIGYGIISFSVGSFVLLIPHFIAGSYYYGDITINNSSQTNILCRSHSFNASHAFCNNIAHQSTPWVYPLIFIVGLTLCGIGFSIEYNVGLAFIDENVSPTISPLYIAIFHMMAVLGPTLGYVVGGIFSNIYIDWPVVPKDLNSSDPRWIGAWWLGYLIVGCITLVSSIFIFAFPYHLPTYQKSRIKRLIQSKSTNKPVDDSQYGKRWADFPRAFYNVVSNRIFLLAVAGISIDQVLVIGFSTFLPKYIQSQSGASLLTATTISGTTVVISAGIGQILGGFITKRWNLVGSKISKFCFFVCIMSSLSTFVLLISCDNPKIAGLFVPYPHSSNVTMTCNAKCYCDQNLFSPVCGENSITYQSPCHAGCNITISNGNIINTNYSRCSCINSGSENIVSTGACLSQTCSLIYPLIIGIMIMVFTTFLSFTPTLTVVLRSIPESQTTFGMGVEGVIYRISGGLLGPVIFGYAMDSSCSLWNEQCDQRQFCWRYDNQKLALYIFYIALACKCLKVFIYAMLWYFHRREEMYSAGKINAEEKEKSSLANGNNEKNGLGSTVEPKISSERTTAAVVYAFPLETQV
ncbi:uncharacterized protein TRIADDRAFT_20218 [Trichoplax adhaerens]|uniref:Solute carrier organic anion transporter family member n=1 Tax=Trichoplax adhaerens TaxID=10228 RepID=B3RLK9_TRIAD|nr:hypothetical protein TRIADDRAFT_20218 [Trichoplax adhaerens]EDV28797.1 hypothetical protein TRIADDRAFT_20218 [Trichoplax adhaerens]|eukprot:XP_002107999.1 hypothetical protein TRIADDRAFT_20218 [Trichoplax adhaerens]